MADTKKPAGQGNFITEAFDDLLEGIGDVMEGKIFDFGTQPEKEVKTDGNGDGSSASVPAVPATGKGKPGKPVKGKSASEQLRDAFTVTEETGETTGVEGTAGTETGDTAVKSGSGTK